MADIKFIVLAFAVIGAAVVVGRIAFGVARLIRAIGLSELVVRFKFHNDNTTTKQLKK